jgi:hypothetical protein
MKTQEHVLNFEQQLNFFEGVAAAALVNFKIKSMNPEAAGASPSVIRDEFKTDPLIQATVFTLKKAVMMMIAGELRVVVQPTKQAPLVGKN